LKEENLCLARYNQNKLELPIRGVDSSMAAGSKMNKKHKLKSQYKLFVFVAEL